MNSLIPEALHTGPVGSMGRVFYKAGWACRASLTDPWVCLPSSASMSAADGITGLAQIGREVLLHLDGGGKGHGVEVRIQLRQ